METFIFRIKQVHRCTCCAVVELDVIERTFGQGPLELELTRHLWFLNTGDENSEVSDRREPIDGTNRHVLKIKGSLPNRRE